MNKGTAITKQNGLDYNWAFPTIFGKAAWGDLVESFFEDFDNAFGRDQVVPCDVIQHKDEKGNIASTEIQYALAGYNKEDVTIEVNDNKLYLTIDKTVNVDDVPEKRQYVHKGISHRRIEAAYSLNGYDKDNIQASFENGVLSVKLPVSQKSETKKIEVK